MSLKDELELKGWHLSEEGIEELKEGVSEVSAVAIIQKALDIDLREISRHFFTDDIYRGKVDSVTGPCVLQIQKVKNVAAPKYEYGGGAPPLLRVHLTDGHVTVSAVQWGNWKSLSQDTPPGTKIFIKPVKVPLQNSFLLLSESQFTVLGGNVEALVHKWEVSRSLATHIRTGESTDSGPPKWIPFGQPIHFGDTKNLRGNFRSLDQDSKEQKEDDTAFKQQRLANIAEISRAKEGKVKVFGGGRERPANKHGNDSSKYNNYKPSSYGQNTSHVPNSGNPGATKGSSNFSRRHNENQDSHKSDKEIYRDPSTLFNGSLQEQYETEKNHKPQYDPKRRINGNITPIQWQKGPSQQQTQNRLDSSSNSNHRGMLNQRNERRQPNVNHDNFRNSYDRPDELSYRTSQMKLQEKGDSAEHSVFKPFLRPGAEVFAKYWEDNKFYRAIVHAVGDSTATCVVHFVEYGNYEEVLMNDVRPLSSGMNGSTSSHQNYKNGPQSSCANQGQDHFTGVLEFRRGGYKPFVHHRGNRDFATDTSQEKQRERGTARPSVKLYQPPPQRRQM